MPSSSYDHLDPQRPARCPPRIRVACDSQDAERAGVARSLAKKLALSMADPAAGPAADVLLVVTDDQLEVRDLASPSLGSVSVDFVKGRAGYRRRVAGGQRHLLARAIGLRGDPLTVVDATAGLGRDAFILACLGCDVVAVERSPILGALIEDALRRACERGSGELDEVVRRFRWVVADARDYLKSLAETKRPDVVYLDPMYPPRGKSALAKKESRICGRLAGGDEDEAELLSIARGIARRRVVVKRHPRSPTLGDAPSGHVQGKSVRFDIYSIR